RLRPRADRHHRPARARIDPQRGLNRPQPGSNAVARITARTQQLPSCMSRRRLTSIAALAAAGLLGGVAALGGGALFGELGKDTTTTGVQTAATATPAAVASAALSINAIYRRSAPGVVQIVSTGQTGQSADPFFGTPFSTPGQQALGSGFVLDKEGHIVTNYHVVQGA